MIRSLEAENSKALPQPGPRPAAHWSASTDRNALATGTADPPGAESSLTMTTKTALRARPLRILD